MIYSVKHLKVKQKLSLLVSVFILGFLIFGVVSYLSFSKVKVNGPIYNHIVQGKDLIADILPPPEYIIESYLVALQMVNETDPTKLDELIKRSQNLRNEYEGRHQFWLKELEPGVLKTTMVEDSYLPAEAFFEAMEKQLIPFIKSGDKTNAEAIANGILKQKYEEHRTKIDEVVVMATQRNVAYEATSKDTVVKIIFILIGLCVLIVAVTIVIWMIISQSFKPLYHMTTILKNISEGEGDLTRRIAIDSKDEIGDMAKYFNHFMDKIQDIVKNIYATTVMLSDSSNNLLSISNKMETYSEKSQLKTQLVGTTVGAITTSISDVASATSDASLNMNIVVSSVEEISATIRNLATASELTSKGIANASELATQMSGNINNLSDSSKQVSTSVSSVATAVKEINISLNEIDKNCVRSIHITTNAGEKAKDTNAIISKLDKSSKQIEKIINVINNIADQTNMLALNAAIEAAGAGESGKGFAVVANEVKELAKQTAEATEEISQQIEAMQGNMSGAVTAVETITEVIAEITLITNTIAAAVTEQSATTGEILKAVVISSDRVNQITMEIGEIAENSGNAAKSISNASMGIKEIARSSSELSTAANDAAKNLDQVSQMVLKVANTSNAISDGAKEILYNIDDIRMASTQTTLGAKDTNVSAKNMTETANKLYGLVNKFKI